MNFPPNPCCLKSSPWAAALPTNSVGVARAAGKKNAWKSELPMGSPLHPGGEIGEMIQNDLI